MQLLRRNRADFTVGGLISLTVFGVFCTGNPASAQNLILNPGFESGALSPWTVSGNGSIQTYASYNVYGGSGELPAYGADFFAFNSAESTPNAVLAQTVATVVGQSYTVNFLYGDYSLQTSPTVQAVNASVYNGGFTAAQLSSSAPAAVASNLFTSTQTGTNANFSSVYGIGDSFSFVATGTATTLAFADQATNTTQSSDGVLDNVSITTTAAAPEPTGVLLMAFGALPAIGIVVKRRKA